MGQATLPTFTHHALAGAVVSGAEFVQHHEHRRAGHGEVLSVALPLQSLFPSTGFERGHVYAIGGDAPLSLLFSLVAEPTTHGSWFAMVDINRAGLLAAYEHGVALHRTLCVASHSVGTWPQVVGALVDGIDFVVVSSPPCNAHEARRLVARAKANGTVIIVLGRPGAFEVDTAFVAHTMNWQFDTHAESRIVQISATGRRVYGKYSCTVQLPAAHGAVAEVTS